MDAHQFWLFMFMVRKMSFKMIDFKWMIFFYLRVKDKYDITQAFSVDPVYLQYMQMDKAIDYRVI
jgi:hypothetical protein